MKYHILYIMINDGFIIYIFINYVKIKFDLQLSMQSVPITIDVVSSNLDQDVHHYVITFVSDM